MDSISLFTCGAGAPVLPLCDVSRLLTWVWSFFINLSFWSSSSSKSWIKSGISYWFTLTVTFYPSYAQRTMFSAVNREVSSLSLLLTSFSISCCLFKWSFSSFSSSTLPWSSLFSPSSSSAFSSKYLKNHPKSGWTRYDHHYFNQERHHYRWVIYLRCELSSVIFFWRLWVISLFFSVEWHKIKAQVKTVICFTARLLNKRVYLLILFSAPRQGLQALVSVSAALKPAASAPGSPANEIKADVTVTFWSSPL